MLLMRIGRSISDDNWEEIDAAHITIWEKAKSLFRVFEHKHGTGTIRIEFDWSPVLARLRQHYRIMSQIFDPRVKKKDEKVLRFPQRPVRVRCTVSVPRDKKAKDALASVHPALYYAESTLHDLFLILNLAAPGSCSLWRAALRPPRGHARWLGSDLSLSDYPFDNAYMGNYWNNWPAPKILELDKVAQWYRTVRNGINQIPENRAQKVLFALMHICKADAPLDTIIWLFYALETLFDTQPGENRRALTNRIGLILSPNDKQRSYLKDELRKLYDIRSGFAHGGREIAHPMNNEQLDKRVEGKFRELMYASEFGFAVLLTSVQSVIERGCAELSFKETLVGVSLANGGRPTEAG